MNQRTSEQRDKAFDPVALLAISWRHRAIVLAVIVCCLFLGLAYISLAAPKYTSVSQILIDPRSLQVVGNDIAARTQSTDGSALDAESQALVLMSASVLEEVIRREKLETHPLFGAKPDGIADLIVRGSAAADPTPLARALRLLRRAIAVKRAERTYVIDIAATVEDRQLSARIANAVASIYLEKEGEARSNAARRAAESLSARLNELRTSLRLAEERAEAFKRDNKLLQSEGRPLLDVQLGDLSTQLTAARARSNELRSRLEQIRQAKQRENILERIPETLQSTTVASLRTQYSLAVRAEAEARSLFGPRHPSYIAVAAQTSAARSELAAEIDRVASSISSDLARADAAETGLRRQIEALRGQTVENNELLLRLRELTREVEANRSIYEAFLARVRELSEQQRFDTSNSRIVSTAFPPAWPSGPPALLVLIASILFGLAVGSALAWLHHNRTRRPVNV